VEEEEEESVLPIRFPPKLLAALFACLLAYLLAIKRKTDFVVIVVLIPPAPNAGESFIAHNRNHRCGRNSVSCNNCNSSESSTIK
jgi:hypothetical protein